MRALNIGFIQSHLKHREPYANLTDTRKAVHLGLIKASVAYR